MSIKNNTTSLQSVLEALSNKAAGGGGVELPNLTNEGSASDLLSGKQLIDQDGNIVTGTIQTKTSSNLTASGKTVTVPAGYYASQATKSVSTATQATPSISIDSVGKITASSIQSAGYVDEGTKTATKQLTTQAAKTVTPSTSEQTAVASGVYTTGTVKVSAVPTQTKTATPTTSSQTITPDSGKFLSSVTVNAMPTATQATPSITVNSSGLITASSNQSAGYVSAGTKSATKQLTTQAAQTITPTTSNQTIASGKYLTGSQTIKGDANLVAGNIKSGVSIFGVSGSYVGTEVENLDEEIAAQDALIASLQSKLDGDVSINNTFETCVLSINTDEIYCIEYTCVTQNGLVSKTSYDITNGSQFTDILKNSIIIIKNPTGNNVEYSGELVNMCAYSTTTVDFNMLEIFSINGNASLTGISLGSGEDW